MSDLLAVGCYTAETGGRGRGIALVERDSATGRLGGVAAVHPAPSPSFLVASREGPLRVVHAAHELPDGLVSTWHLGSTGNLRQLTRVSSGGGSPCHLAVHPSSLLLVVSGYDGVVSAVPVRGRPVASAGGPAQVIRPQPPGGAPGPVADRQAGPHPHSAAFLDERHVVVADLGTDELRVHAVVLSSGAPDHLDPEPVQVVRTPPGSGPRTALVREGRLHVTGELDGTLLTADVTAGRLGALRSSPALAGPGPVGPPSEVAAVGGRHLVVATRGEHPAVTVHAVDDDGTPRALVDLPLAPFGARNPRHVLALGRHLYVCAQDSDLLLHLELAGLGEGDDDEGPPRVVAHSAARLGSPAVAVAL
ncbi:lactonase family protein [Quadrisphaera setariae]|uniref:Lactonase family protein n=1 Tax=Quadrisphaera setariae TaxID=2593304 RepID=A0A5C8ZGR4_9ACTN|nr:beta-propeller fold lactonase family protein [Quadrisphaera setariae]TXR56273.1 lactonase family protein [Quadrisphaera setariae]